MANALSTLRNSPINNPDEVYVLDTITGNYVAGGDTCDLTPTNFSDKAGVGVIGPDSLPVINPEVLVTNGGGYYAQWVPGTTLANGKIMWFAPGGGQVAAAAYPAAILAAIVVLRIILNR